MYEANKNLKDFYRVQIMNPSKGEPMEKEETCPWCGSTDINKDTWSI